MTNIQQDFKVPTVTYIIHDENWKIIPNWEHYAVSKEGNLFSLRFGKIMLPQKGRKNTNHLKIRLSDNGKWRGVYVHRLVAYAFIPNPNNKPYINHIDGNPLNNHVDNLEWCTAAENTQHSYRMGFQVMPKKRAIGESRSIRLKDVDVIEIKRLLSENNLSNVQIARMFKVTSSTISSIKRGLTWNHIPSLIAADLAISSKQI